MTNPISNEERWAKIEPKARKFLSAEGYRIAKRCFLGPEPGDFGAPAFIRRQTYPKKGGEQE